MTSIAARYLARIGAAAPERADLESLAALLTAHTRTIPFENLTSFTGHPVDLDRDAVFDKLLDRNRGGYCFEHATLSSAALSDLGFDTEPVLARVYLGDQSRAPIRSHNATVVRLAGSRYLYDPGFGGTSPIAPLVLDGGPQPQQTPDGVYRIVDRQTAGIPEHLGPDVRWMLQLYLRDTWTNQYGITTGAVVPADVEALNWYTSTSPESAFTTHLMATVVGPDSRVTLAGRVLRHRGSTGTVERSLETEAEFDTALRVDLGLSDIDKEQVAAAWVALGRSWICVSGASST